MMHRQLVLLILCYSLTSELLACRFTIREIGFSTLEQEFYSLVHIDAGIDPHAKSWENVRKQLLDSNIRLVLLDQNSDKAHPFVKQAAGAGMAFPASLLVSPDGRMLLLEGKAFSAIAEEVLDSPLRARLRADFPKNYATALWIESRDEAKNTEASSWVELACEKISNIMPQMPKLVMKGPEPLRISKTNFSKEKVLLWSLGIEKVPEEPLAYVIYGRGRLMGEKVTFDLLKEDHLFRLMAMIGADCECGLDRKWMLGHQIPLLWPVDIQHQLVKETGFDVDNPMILSEMSIILAREPNHNATGSVTFAPEIIDLDLAFKDVPAINYERSDVNRFWSKKLLVIMVLGIIVLLMGLFLFYRKRRS